jgi:two-component system sensor histidine kinase VicK
MQVITGGSFFALVGEMLARVQGSLDCFVDSKSMSSFSRAVASAGRFPGFDDGTKLRCVTEITKENLSDCKEAMKRFDVYHTSLIKGNFAIADQTTYLGQLDGDKSLYVHSLPFVASQLFLFNSVIDRAVPAKQRMLEIGRGVESEFMETVRDPLRVKRLTFDLIRSAIYEICILFSTKNSFLIAEREGILSELGAVSERGIKVKLLVMQDDAVKEISNAKLKAARQDVQVNYLQQFMPTKITTFIIDQTKCLTVEVNDDTRETFQEAIGLATFSNSESTVFSNSSIFESLWIQSELNKQRKAKQAYFQMFKGFKIKDEVYDRRWSFGRDENKEQE